MEIEEKYLNASLGYRLCRIIILVNFNEIQIVRLIFEFKEFNGKITKIYIVNVAIAN